MIVNMELKGKEFREHRSGLFVAKDGEVFIPKSGKHNEHFTYGSTVSHGYKAVGYKYKLYQVHRLVAECFIPNPNNYNEVDHINRDKTLNNVENLRWSNRSMQQYNRVLPKNNALSKKVLQYTLEGEFVKEWPSVRECGRNGFHQGNVCDCCNGKLKHYKKFIWRYNNNEELEII